MPLRIRNSLVYRKSSSATGSESRPVREASKNTSTASFTRSADGGRSANGRKRHSSVNAIRAGPTRRESILFRRDTATTKTRTTTSSTLPGSSRFLRSTNVRSSFHPTLTTAGIRMKNGGEMSTRKPRRRPQDMRSILLERRPREKKKRREKKQ